MMRLIYVCVLHVCRLVIICCIVNIYKLIVFLVQMIISCFYFAKSISLFSLLEIVLYFSAVQSERKPADSREKPVTPPMAASSQRLYVRKDLRSPLAALPTFSSDKVCLHYNNLTSWLNFQKNMTVSPEIDGLHFISKKKSISN